MQVQLKVEIDSKGIIGQMGKVRRAENKLRWEMDRLDEMLRTAGAKETGNSEESPANEDEALNLWLQYGKENQRATDDTASESQGKLEVVIQLRGEGIIERMNEFIEKRVMEIYEKYPYAKVRIEVLG